MLSPTRDACVTERRIMARIAGKMVSVPQPAMEGDGVVLRPTGLQDFDLARLLFNDPGFYERWGGRPQSDEEIKEKYLGTRSPDVECFFVEVEGEVVGFAQHHAADDGGEGGGMDLVLLSSARGHGVGSAVVRVIAKFVTTHLGWTRFTVDPDVSNERGVNFWTKVGFIPKQLIDNDSNREPYWLMEWTSRPY